MITRGSHSYKGRRLKYDHANNSWVAKCTRCKKKVTIASDGQMDMWLKVLLPICDECRAMDKLKT